MQTSTFEATLTCHIDAGGGHRMRITAANKTEKTVILSIKKAKSQSVKAAPRGTADPLAHRKCSYSNRRFW